jgi:hypothetical protein
MQETIIKEGASRAGSLFGLFFDPEDGGDMLLQNVDWLSMDYTVFYPRRENSSETNKNLN